MAAFVTASAVMQVSQSFTSSMREPEGWAAQADTKLRVLSSSTCECVCGSVCGSVRGALRVLMRCNQPTRRQKEAQLGVPAQDAHSAHSADRLSRQAHSKVVFDADLVEAAWQQAVCNLPVMVTGAAGEQAIACSDDTQASSRTCRCTVSCVLRAC